MADSSTTRTPVQSADDPKTSNAISAARTYAGGPLAGAPVSSGFGAPGAMPGAGAPAAGCAGGQPGAGGPGEALGSQSNNLSGVDSKLAAAITCANSKFEQLNPGMKVYAFSGVAGRPGNASSYHPGGGAVDVAIYGTDGVMLNNLRVGDTPAFRAYEAHAQLVGQCYDQQNGAGSAANDLRWGGNFSESGKAYRDTMHYDVGGRSGGSTADGNIFKGTQNPRVPNNSNPNATPGVYDGPKDGASANAGGSGEALGSKNDVLSGQGNTANAGCAPGQGGSGCQPISAAAPAAASSIAAGKGLAGLPGGLGQGLQQLAGAAVPGLQAGMQVAAAAAAGFSNPSAILGTVVGAVGGPGAGAILSVAQGGLTNAMTQITQGVLGQLTTLGNGALSGALTSLTSLTGVIPAAFQTGNVSGLMTGVLQNSVNTLIQSNVPNLGGFTNAFGAVSGAVGGATNLSQVVSGSINRVFGKATDGILGTPTAIPGFNELVAISNARGDNVENQNMDPLGLELESWKESIKKNVTLTGPLEEVLPAVANKDIDGFSSLFLDYNSFATQGLGNLTDHLLGLGTDLLYLGKVGDLQDLFNIGTARQLARQLIENGLGMSTGLLQELKAQRIDVADLYDDQYEPLIFEILEGMVDEEVLLEVMDVMRIADQVNLNSVADLLIPEKVLNHSFIYNRFATFQDMAVTLALCTNGLGRLKHYADLGLLMINMETAEDLTEALGEYTLLRLDEKEKLVDTLPPDSKFGNTGPTVADLIGSVAGYVHEATIPRMVELHDQIFSDSYFDDFKSLMTLLTDVLTGVYLVVGPPDTHVVPTTAGYTHGTYYTLDAAAIAVANSIESELEYIRVNLPAADPDLWDLLQEYEGRHRASAEFLSHEKKMRRAYGVDFGPSRLTEYFYGDGSTLAFALNDSVADEPRIVVSISGVDQRQYISWNYASGTVTFASTPASGSVISIGYDTGYTKPSSSNVDVWNFANNLESYALETGYGAPADFLNRITTDDYHGQRIKALMIQSRNKVRLEQVGIGCPGYNRLLNDSDRSSLSFTTVTGVWTDKPNRAAEVWLQQKMKVDGVYDYYLDRLSTDVEATAADRDLLMNNTARQLLFELDGNMIGSDLLVELYNGNNMNSLANPVRKDLSLEYNEEDLPTGGIVLGSYGGIISQLINIEGMSSGVFNYSLSEAESSYLEKSNIDLEFLVALCQKVLLATVADHYGITEDIARQLFGVQSISKNVLNNTSNGY